MKLKPNFMSLHENGLLYSSPRKEKKRKKKKKKTYSIYFCHRSVAQGQKNEKLETLVFLCYL